MLWSIQPTLCKQGKVQVAHTRTHTHTQTQLCATYDTNIEKLSTHATQRLCDMLEIHGPLMRAELYLFGIMHHAQLYMFCAGL